MTSAPSALHSWNVLYRHCVLYRRCAGWPGVLALPPLCAVPPLCRLAWCACFTAVVCCTAAVQAGLVFQFPERHFIGRTMSQELTVGWPLSPEQVLERQVRRRCVAGLLERGGSVAFLGGACCPLPNGIALSKCLRINAHLHAVSQALAVRTHQVLAAVGLEALPLDVPLAHLSDGYKRCDLRVVLWPMSWTPHAATRPQCLPACCQAWRDA